MVESPPVVTDALADVVMVEDDDPDDLEVMDPAEVEVLITAMVESLEVDESMEDAIEELVI